METDYKSQERAARKEAPQVTTVPLNHLCGEKSVCFLLWSIKLCHKKQGGVMSKGKCSSILKQNRLLSYTAK